MTFKEQIGFAIAAARKEKKWEQRELAEKAGFSRVYINNIENGSANFTADALEKICKQLKVTVCLQGVVSK